MEYGERIRHIREALSLSQSELAERLGVNKQMISDIERGKQKRFSPHIEQKLIDIFNISEPWLLKGEGEPFKNFGTRTSTLTIEEELILKYFKQVPQERRLDAVSCILNCIREFS